MNITYKPKTELENMPSILAVSVHQVGNNDRGENDKYLEIVMVNLSKQMTSYLIANS